jgi:hypothetical protein
MIRAKIAQVQNVRLSPFLSDIALAMLLLCFLQRLVLALVIVVMFHLSWFETLVCIVLMQMVPLPT